jgi:hypothetical protein
MFRKILIAFLLVVGTATARAHFFVNIGPPAPVVEVRAPPPPGPGYVWMPGYYRWDGRAYMWVPGSYVIAPWPGARWIPPHWEHRHGGWLFIEGHWR